MDLSLSWTGHLRSHHFGLAEFHHVTKGYIDHISFNFIFSVIDQKQQLNISLNKQSQFFPFSIELIDPSCAFPSLHCKNQYCLKTEMCWIHKLHALQAEGLKRL